MRREAALAYWINRYNALTVRAVLEFHPIRSLRDKVGSGYNV